MDKFKTIGDLSAEEVSSFFKEVKEKLSQKYRSEKVRRWEIWSIFHKDLPVRVNTNKGSFDVWFGKNYRILSILRTSKRNISGIVNTAFINPSTKSYGFHRTLVVSRIIQNSSNLYPRAIIAFAKDEERKPYTIQVGENVWVFYDKMWDLESSPGENLIEKYASFVWNKGRVKTLIHEILMLKEPKNLENLFSPFSLNELRDMSPYKNGELILIKSPYSRSISLPAMIIGDTAMIGYKLAKGFPQYAIDVLFVPLIRYQERHERSEFFLPLPKDIVLNGNRLSVVAYSIRYVSLKLVNKWPMKLPSFSYYKLNEVIEKVRLKIKVLFD